jgi:hypothetical protein
MTHQPISAFDCEIVFENRTDAHDFLAEAVVAAYAAHHDLHEHDWPGGHGKLIDVIWPEHALDVKHAFVMNVYGPDGKKPHLGFMGGKREIEVREGVTHYALVYFHDNARVEVSRNGIVTVTSPPATVFLVPADDVAKFYRAYLANGSGPGKGRNLFAPVEAADQWRVFGPPATATLANPNT